MQTVLKELYSNDAARISKAPIAAFTNQYALMRGVRNQRKVTTLRLSALIRMQSSVAVAEAPSAISDFENITHFLQP